MSGCSHQRGIQRDNNSTTAISSQCNFTNLSACFQSFFFCFIVFIPPGIIRTGDYFLTGLSLITLDIIVNVLYDAGISYGMQDVKILRRIPIDAKALNFVRLFYFYKPRRRISCGSTRSKFTPYFFSASCSIVSRIQATV